MTVFGTRTDEMFALMRRDKNTTLEMYYSAFTKHRLIVKYWGEIISERINVIDLSV